MAKFYGIIGYGVSVETKPDVWKKEIVEKPYSGDLIKNMQSRYQSADKLNDNINVTNAISIVADPFAYENFRSMLYVEYMGTKWKIESVEVQYPRLILTTGGVYNGRKTASIE